mmetsp:Transcript_11552/g.36924  ORF Transcript_11552/g.36924 Transcript_11552/m.36924 type:complete len:310 (+) Transcript_11552:1232-2161(+)
MFSAAATSLRSRSRSTCGRRWIQVCRTVPEYRAWRQQQSGSVGFVPTMGALHDGHLSLVDAARDANAATVASIFVNPLQFAPHEDFDRYPRRVERDVELLESHGVSAVFVPDARQMYASKEPARVVIPNIDSIAEGAARPGFFSGVATVVLKLFNIVQPTAAYFGQKDGLQCLVVRKMIRDFDLPVQLCVQPTIRELNGLAMSSRNEYLTPEQRAGGGSIFRALTAGAEMLKCGTPPAAAVATVREELAAESLFDRVEYVSALDTTSLQELDGGAEGTTSLSPGAEVMLSCAVGLGRTRLIDNVLVSLP